MGRRLRVPTVLVQFVKFGIVGISNTLITFAVYTVLLKVFGVWYLAASAIGFIVGAINGFLLNRRWTFADHVGDAYTPVRWGIVQTGGLGLNLGLLYLLVHDASIDKLLAQAIATVVVTVTTFLVNRAWTFRHVPLAEEPSRAHQPLAEDAEQGEPGRDPPAARDHVRLEHQRHLERAVDRLRRYPEVEAGLRRLAVEAVEHPEQDRDREQQGVEVARALLPPAGLLGDRAQRAHRVAALMVVDLVVAAPEPVICGDGEQQSAAWRDHAPQLAKGAEVVLEVLDDVERDSQVEARVGERHLQHGPFDHLAAAALARLLDTRGARARRP